MYLRTPRSAISGKQLRPKLYAVWVGMKQRCRPGGSRSTHWGDRGISVCEEWGSYDAFREWAINAEYRKGLSIDRIDNDGNYEPDNCRWATPIEQMANRGPGKHRSRNRGTSHGRSVVTAEMAVEILRSDASTRTISERFGISMGTARRVRAMPEVYLTPPCVEALEAK